MRKSSRVLPSIDSNLNIELIPVLSKSYFYVDTTRYVAGFYFFISFFKVVVETVRTKSDDDYINLEDIGVPFDVVAVAICFFLIFVLSIHSKRCYLIAACVMMAINGFDIYTLFKVQAELLTVGWSNEQYTKKWAEEYIYRYIVLFANIVCIILLAKLYSLFPGNKKAPVDDEESEKEEEINKTLHEKLQ